MLGCAIELVQIVDNFSIIFKNDFSCKIITRGSGMSNAYFKAIL